jgi:hypothetical protein
MKVMVIKDRRLIRPERVVIVMCRDREQRELNDYVESMPNRPADYMSDEDTSSDSGNGFENLCQD